MTATIEGFFGAFPEFETIRAGAVEYQIALSADLTPEHAWGKFTDRAIYLLAAHSLSLRYDLAEGRELAGVSEQSGSVGVAQSGSASTSGLSQTNALSALVTGDDPFKADLARTPFGLDYLSLAARIFPGAYVVY